MILKKKQIIVLVFVIVLIFLGIICWAVIKTSKVPVPAGGSVQQEGVFSITGKIVAVDVDNNFLVVVPKNETREIKVFLSKETSLEKNEYLDNSSGVEGENNFPKQTRVIKTTILDIKAGDSVFIKSKEDVSGKTEVSQVEFITVLP